MSVLNHVWKKASRRREARPGESCRGRRLILEALEDRCVPSSDVVIEWNEVLLNQIRTNKTAPPPASRILAIVQTAVFDAVNAIDGSYAPYVLSNVPPRLRNGSVVAAAAQAAHDTVAAFYPSEQAALDARLEANLAAINNQGALKKGVEVGKLAAAAVLQARANDGADAVVPYTPGSGPGVWIPTPPGLLPAAFPQWPYITPFTMTSGSQFRPAGSPALTSDDYAAAFNEVKDYGGDGVTTPTIRTADQTVIANFWADGPGTETPPGHWNSIAADVAQARGNTLVQNARLFALLDLALADAAISAWDAKYEDNLWRPISAIRNADLDGNADTAQDSTWTPLLVTPNFPTYTSGHSTFSSAAAAILAQFYGTDDISFTTGSDFLPGVTRSFTSFSAAAAEAGQSRIYGGIHFQFDNQDALASGAALAHHAFQNYLQPVATAHVSGAGAVYIPALDATALFAIGVSIRADGTASGHFICHTPGATRLAATVRETTKTITIEVKGDNKREANETLYLDLFGLSSNALFSKNRGIGTILNDD
jgi:hypothetical protein